MTDQASDKRAYEAGRRGEPLSPTDPSYASYKAGQASRQNEQVAVEMGAPVIGLLALLGVLIIVALIAYWLAAAALPALIGTFFLRRRLKSGFFASFVLLSTGVFGVYVTLIMANAILRGPLPISAAAIAVGVMLFVVVVRGTISPRPNLFSALLISVAITMSSFGCLYAARQYAFANLSSSNRAAFGFENSAPSFDRWILRIGVPRDE